MGSGTALVLLLPGLGDALAASPILRGLRRDDWIFDAMTWQAPVSEYARDLGAARDVMELPLQPGAAHLLHAISELRSRRYDLSILPFPATRWQYSLVARGVGAKKLWMHEYGGASSAIARTGPNERVALRGGHRLAENLRLARAIGFQGGQDDLAYLLPSSWRAQRLLGTLGIHPGSMAYKGNETKRWPYERFVALARSQAASGRKVRFFLGPHEADEARRAERDFGSNEAISIVRETLAEAARQLSECEVFVGNDAGFTHLASGLGVKTLGLYGMTSEVRGAPIGPAVALRPSLCPACHDEGSHRFECVRHIGYRCILRDMEFDAVRRQVEDSLRDALGRTAPRSGRSIQAVRKGLLVKEQAADLRAPALDLPLPAALQKVVLPALFVALALLVTTGYGSGVQLNDGLPSLHINPLQFLGQLLHAWNPALGMGFHTGFWIPYQMPYSWTYGLAQLLGVSQDLAQHAAVFLVYLGCLWSMYYCLRSVAPWLDEIARIAGACAYLFNMYVALNSQAQIVWLLTYATLPAMVGVTAKAMRGEIYLWRAALGIALLVLVGGGVNPPLVAINVIILAIFVVVTIALDPKPQVAASRIAPLIVAASIAAIAINLYWVVPFVDYFRTVWLNGVLTEAPSMHNAATSFANVLRGLGHWATFVSFAGRAYFPWAAAYAAGLFGALLWFVPIVAFGGIAFARNQRPVTLFFLLVTIVSIPIVVGYYHDALGDAVTTPIYDQFYRNFPGFQMFRFSYKWVAGVEFGMSGLYAFGVYAMVTALRDEVEKLRTLERRNWNWTVSAARTLAIVLPILIFIPVLVNKMNYPAAPLPAWEYRESALVGSDQNQRVALFPTQYLEQFDWGNPQFYIENSLVDRPMIYGLLGSESSEGTDMWVRRAYRASREGLPFAADMFRVMGVDTILERDDFIPAIDFSSPEESRFNSTTLTHDLLHRVIGAAPQSLEGPLRVYHLSGALPLFYGVAHPVISTVPAFSDAYLGDVDAMAKGRAQFDPPSRSADEFTAAMQSLSPILPGSRDQIRDLAVNEALYGGILVRPPSADAALLTSLRVRNAGVYAVFAREQSLLYYRAPPHDARARRRTLLVTTVGGCLDGVRQRHAYAGYPLGLQRHYRPRSGRRVRVPRRPARVAG